MSSRVPRGGPGFLGVLAVFLISGLAPGSWAGEGEPVFEDPTPYDVLTNNRVEVVNFLPEPFSGLAQDSDGGVWFVNPYGSVIGLYTSISAAPDLVADTGVNPISIAVWEPTALPEDRKIVVVCRGSHGAYLHNAQTGEVEAVVLLDSEPADLVVDSDNGWAFVSCQGDNTIARIDLDTFTVLNRYEPPVGQRPGSLVLDRGDPAMANDNRVYVAMAVTGNNSVPINSNATLGNAFGVKGVVFDLDPFPPETQLPDEDVYRIDPFTSQVDPVVRGAGSLLFDLGFNPDTGSMWVLSTDSNNKDLDLNTEPEIRGMIVTNQLMVVPGVGSGSGLIQAPAEGIDLDDHDPGTAGPQYDPLRSVNQARTLDFMEDPDLFPGLAFIASAQSDVMLVTDANGNRLGDFPLPEKSQCYSVMVWDPDEHIVLALCLGTMTIEVFNWGAGLAPIGSLPIGHDPTPDQIRRGRDVFMNGKFSMDARSSCGSCHPGGMSDQLGWSIGGEPCDFKDVMLTQSLLSIADTFPHHWRGERALEDFRKAFVGLLGADPAGSGTVTEEPNDQEMEDFVVLMQSLQAPANPIESYRRVLDDSLTADPAPNGMFGSAVRGQRAFQDVPNFNGNTCAECHSLETGTVGNLFSEVASTAPRAIQLESAHLRQLQNRGSDTAPLTANGNTVLVAIDGFSSTHNGAVNSVFDFIFGTPAFFDLNDQERVDTTNFVRQWDQGISPGCHWTTYFEQNSPERTGRLIEAVLLQGARNRWNDVAAFGRLADGNGVLQPIRLWFDPSQGGNGLFFSEDPDAPGLPWSAITGQVNEGRAELTFVGLAPENGRRFALDPDNDGLLTGQENNLGTDPQNPDSDGDGWWDGHEFFNGDDPTVAQLDSADDERPALEAAQLDFANARVAKYHVRFNEDVTYTVSYTVTAGTASVTRSFSRDYFSRRDTFVLTHTEPSDPDEADPLLVYNAEITFTDRNGNQTGPLALPSFNPARTQQMEAFDTLSHVSSLEWVKEDRSGDTLDAEVKITIDSNQNPPDFDPLPGIMVFSIVSILDTTENKFVQSDTFTTPQATSFQVIDGMDVITTYNDEGTPGPFIVSALTDSNGEAVIAFQQSGLSPGQTVKVSVMGTVFPAEGQAPGVFVQFDLARMQLLLLENASELKLDF